MSITPVPPAQPHSSSKEGICCCSISPAFIHFGLPQVQLLVVFYASLGAMLLRERSPHWKGAILRQTMLIECVLLMLASLGLSPQLFSSVFFVSCHHRQLYDPLLASEHLLEVQQQSTWRLSQQPLCCDLATTSCSSWH